MSRTPVAVSLLLYISLQVGKQQNNYIQTFHYHHSIELNAVQIIFARMNVALILQMSKFMFVQILIRDKLLFGKAGQGLSDSESLEL